MKTLRGIFLLIVILIPLTGCGSILYISKLGWHQGQIAFYSVPVQEILEDPWIGERTKEKIGFIQEVKRFGEKRLGLEGAKSYLTFYEVRGPILHVVTACEKDRLQLYGWKFPIIGRVTYKGFFTREGALKEKGVLDGKGYDTFVQRAAAFSTLGWFKDPIFSSMLDWKDVTLANLILHEMAHATVYFRGETDFNEQMATFIGNRGAIEFLKEKHGSGSKEVTEAIHIQKDDLLLSEWIDQACRRLSTYYAQELSRDEKLEGREEVFRSVKEDFREMKGQFKTNSYQHFEKIDLNNAVILAYRRYIHRLEKFEALYEHLGWDLGRVVEFLKETKASGDPPFSFLERWLNERGITVPSSLR